ncbi:MAG: helix-turn-helix domain-containing protein [Actinomycetota bacterium]|nr:helix-turn-helix domain-containing protein [Actinomycetota bacterium]
MVEPLKKIRQDRGIGVRRLSSGAPVAPRTIITTEKGESLPSLETIRKISRFLKVDPMEVAEFRAALEKQGFEELPPEDLPQPSPPARPAGAQEPKDRGQMIEELVRLMRSLGRTDVDRAYRLLFEDEPPT